MNSLDLIIVLLVIAYAISGLIQGFLANLVATAGLMVCGLLALLVVPHIVNPDNPTLGSSLLALGLVVGAAATGQIVGAVVGTDLRRSIRTDAGRWADAIGGAMLSVVAVLTAAWAIGYSVSGSSVPYLADASRESTILRKVDGVMPSQAADVLRNFNEVIDANLFPRYLDPFQPEDIVSIGPPDPATLTQPGVAQAAGSTYKILGEAECNASIEGSGFIYAEGRIMTNAHVVAGVDRPVIVTDSGRVPATVVVFDPQLDVAVLAADVAGAPLEFDTSGEAGQPAAILGFPGNGPFDVQAARIREIINLRGPDIYENGEGVRETFSLRGLVRSGNSGGPLISEEGKVLGVIFAASITDNNTGYALTASQVADAAARGIATEQGVDTGSCS